MSRIEKALEKLASQTEKDQPGLEKELIKKAISRDQEHFYEEEISREQVKLDPMLLSLHQPFSLVSEQFKALRTHLLRVRNNQKRNLFLITSTIGQEGKSVVSLNLAISIAQGFNEQVLLIECDFRKPSLASMLGLRASSGLAEYLMGQDISHRLLRHTGIDNLALIPTGNPPSNPAELLGSLRMDTLLRELKQIDRNRIVLIDSPPLVPVTDAAIIAPKVDGIILVIQAYKTQRDAIDKALSTLDGAPIVGAVLNRVPLTETKAYFPKYYTYDTTTETMLNDKTV